MNKERLQQLLFLAALSVGGCSAGDHQDLIAYIEEVKARPAEKPEPALAFEAPDIDPERLAIARDPFEPLSVGTPRERIQPAADVNEVSGPLRSTSPSALRLIRTYQHQGRVVAIVSVSGTEVYRLEVGDPVGPTHTVADIDRDGLVLRHRSGGASKVFHP